MASVKFQGDGDGTVVVSSTSEQVPLESRLVSRQALGEDWRLPVEVFADKYTPARKIRRMKSRAVRSYYHDLNDMIKKYMAIDKVEKRFERRMQRQQSKAVEEGITKAGPYSWYGSSDNLGSRGGGNWMRDSSSSSSSTVALGSTDTELRQLPNHHYYRSHDHGGKKAAAADERAPLMGGPSRADVEQAQTDESELDDEDDEEAEKRRQAEAEENSWHIKLAIHATFWVNVALFVAKTFASVESLSLSIIASTLDSFLDLLSGSVIFFASWIVNGRSRELKFPGGTSRIEPLAVLIFAVAMFTGTPPFCGGGARMCGCVCVCVCCVCVCVLCVCLLLRHLSSSSARSDDAAADSIGGDAGNGQSGEHDRLGPDGHHRLHGGDQDRAVGLLRHRQELRVSRGHDDRQP
jgi:hypothetical protein